MHQFPMKKMYHEFAKWWPLLSPVEDYAEEAAFFGQLFSEAGLPTSPSLLELGSGGGSNAFYLKELFPDVTLTDLSPQMLAISQTLNPSCTHVAGDMRTLRLPRLFDAIFIHDAIDYMTTSADLKQAMETAFVHCRAGGVALFAPDHLYETFEPSTEHGGSDSGEGKTPRSLRYLEWTYASDESRTTYTTDYVYIMRNGDQPPQVEHEQLIGGLFSREIWLTLLRETGFEPQIIVDPYERELFLARKAILKNTL
jgi:SAM-dependent methyltransferase